MSEVNCDSEGSIRTVSTAMLRSSSAHALAGMQAEREDFGAEEAVDTGTARTTGATRCDGTDGNEETETHEHHFATKTCRMKHLVRYMNTL